MVLIKFWIAFGLLLSGAFLVRKLWLGALAAVLYLVVSARLDILTDRAYRIIAIDALSIWLELSLLLLGAYVFSTMLDDQNQWHSFQTKVSTSRSRLIVILLFSWFLVGFLEGISGFGIPAVLVAPLLVTMGLKPFTSIVLSLTGNALSVSFGALGTPVKIGLGVDSIGRNVDYIVLLNVLPALLIPILLAQIYSRCESVNLSWRDDIKLLLGAGICFLVPYVIGSQLSIEYPSVLGGGAGMILFISIFVPASERPSLRLWIATFWPYALFIIVLIFAAAILKDFSWRWLPLTRRISAFQPGVLFLATTFLILLIKKNQTPLNSFLIYTKQAVGRVHMALLTILLLIFFTQLIRPEISMIVTRISEIDYPVILNVVPLLLGTLGSFVTGSATMSNLLFAEDVRNAFLFPISLAMLNTGSAIGNALSLQNIVMVKSIVVSNVTEAEMLKHNIKFVVVYILLVVLVATIWYFA